MTKRQRVIDQEEAPVNSEPIHMAKERIKELERWVELRKEDELKKRQG